MKVIEQHQTTDGLFVFKVLRGDDGDVSLRFEGYAWHTHADVLSSLSGVPEEIAVRKFVDSLIHNRSYIAVARVGNKIRDVWVTDEAVADKYKPENETIEFRHWDGRTVRLK